MQGINQSTLQASNIDPDAAGLKIVTLAMECRRLAIRASQLLADNESLQLRCQNDGHLRDRLAVLERCLQSKDDVAVEACRLARDVAKLKDEVKQKDQMIVKLQSENQALKLSDAESEDKSAFAGSLLDQISGLRQENLLLSKENASMKKNMEGINDLKRDNSKLERIIDDMTSKNTDTNINNDLAIDLTSRIGSLESDNSKLRSRLNEMLDRETDHIHRQESIAALEDRLRSLVASYEDCQSTLDDTIKQNIVLKAQADKLPSYESSISRLIDENSRITEVLTTYSQKLKSDSAAELSRDNAAYRLEVEGLNLELNRAKKQIEEKTEKLKSLVADFSLKSAEASQLEVVLAENDRLADTLAQVGKDLAEKTRQTNALENKLHKLDSDLKASNEESQSHLSSLQATISKQTTEIKQLTQSNDSLSKDNTALQHKCHDMINLENNLRIYQSDSESLKRVNEDLKAYNSSLNEQLADTRKDLSAKTAVLNSMRNIQDKLNDASQSNESLNVKFKLLDGQLNERNKEIDKLKSDLYMASRSTSDLASQAGETAKYRALYLDSQDRLKHTDELTTKIDILQQQLRSLHAANSDLRKAAIDQQTTVVAKHDRSTISGDAFDKMKAMVHELEVELSLLRDRETSLKSQINQMTGKLRLLDSIEADLIVKLQTTDHLRSANDDLASELKKARSDLMRERDQNTHASVDAEDRRILRLDITSKSEQIEELQSKIAVQESERLKINTELRTRVHNLTIANEKMEEELSLERSMASRLKRDLDTMKDKTDILEKLSSKHDLQSASILEKDGIIANLKRRLETYESDQCSTGRRLETHLHTTKEEVFKLTAENDLLKSNMQEKDAKLSLLEDEIKKLRRSDTEKRRLQEDYSKLEASYTCLQVQASSIRDLSDENSTLKAKLHTSESDCDVLRKRISDMVSLMDDLRNFNIDLESNNKSIPKFEARIRQLESSIEDKMQVIATLKDEQSTMMQVTNNHIVCDKLEESRLEQLLAAAESRANLAEGQLTSLRIEIESLRLQNDRQKQELSMADNYLDELRRLSKDCQSKATENQHLQSECTELQSMLRSRDSEILIYRDKLSEALIELEKIPVIEAELKAKKKEVSSLESRYTQMLVESEALRVTMKERETELVGLCTKSDINRHSLASIGIDQMKNELSVMESDRSRWRKKADELEKSMSKLARDYERKVSELQNENKRLSNRLNGVSELTQARADESDQLISEIERSRKQCDLLEFKLKESYAKINHIHEQLDQALIKVEELSGELQTTEISLSRENRRLNDSLQRSEVDLNRLRSLVDRQSEDIRNKSADIAALRQKLSLVNR